MAEIERTTGHLEIEATPGDSPILVDVDGNEVEPSEAEFEKLKALAAKDGPIDRWNERGYRSIVKLRTIYFTDQYGIARRWHLRPGRYLVIDSRNDHITEVRIFAGQTTRISIR